MFHNWILIGLLTVITYLSRIIGVEIMAGRKMSPTLRLYFQYVPIAIITALIIKQIFIPTDGQLTLSLPVLIGCLSTAIIIRITNWFLPSVAIGVMAGLFTRYFFI
ncbi:AzlD domain-containing protein [Desmospora activa]|uniref:Branched-subunit amino acid transport protein n=1 Tax=Desmospora activa DSM 45169 TaxID=1121389 RepID=A0A2T4Z4J7_9BACL|nr:AzlD domain-containing protein [Desmospora activa]PTM56795.1 branched-subunit amino acid transport protein [Desmospora activa DSM 45169]